MNGDLRPEVDLDLTGITAEDRALLGDRWLAAARLEHASIGSFLELASALDALGAPASLVDRARCAALDEALHATLALSSSGRGGA